MPRKRPTMKDVARLAGVTQPTVSYVINGTATISDEVREKVYQAIWELDYKPNYNAVALKTQRTHVIGIVIADITNAYYSHMVSLLEKELSKNGYLALISSTGYKRNVEMEILNRLLDHNVEAFLIGYELGNPESWKLLSEAGRKVITIEAGRLGKAFPGIEIDDYRGAYTATQYLIREGRKKIAYIGQNSDIEALQNREKGYREALEEDPIAREPLIYRTEGPGDKWTEGAEIGKKLAAEKNVDGIVVSSDELAVSMMKMLYSAGIRIPEEVSVIGYDNIPLAELYNPGLTTVAQPLQEVCARAVDMLLRYLKGNEPDSVMLKPELIVRDTTLPAGAHAV